MQEVNEEAASMQEVTGETASMQEVNGETGGVTTVLIYPTLVRLLLRNLLAGFGGSLFTRGVDLYDS